MNGLGTDGTLGSASTGDRHLDTDRIRELVDLMIEKDLAELQIEQHGVNLRLRRPEPHVVAAASVPAGAIIPAPGAGSVDSAGVAAPEHGAAHLIRSPMVGTLFLAPEPGADSFVQVGDRVDEGQTLCIVEAMKLMNEITSDVVGEVVAVLHENGQPVEYGQELFAIRPD